MKIVCEALDLSEALFRVSKACAVRTTVPVLECIKISAVNDSIVLLASDGELSIEKKIKAEVMEEGEVCVPGKTFTDFIGKLIGVSVTLRTNENGLELIYGDNATSFQTLPATEFPKVQTDVRENSFVMEYKEYKDLIAQTVFCCAQDDSRPILKGVLFEIEDDMLTATALDGFRMAVVRKKVKSASGKLRIVCPARTLSEIARIIPEEDGELTVFVQNGMMVELDATTVTSRLYQGEFINYRNITPTEFTTNIVIDKEEFLNSVARAMILIRGDKNNLVLLDIRNDGIRISSASEMGNVQENVGCELYGKELKIAMNSKYISESVKAVPGDKVAIGFNTPVAPFVVHDLAGAEDFYLVLPVRT